MKVPKKLDQKTYKRSILRPRYTALDEMLASEISPLRHTLVQATMECLRFCVDCVLYRNAPPEVWNWTEIIDASNLMQSCIELTYIDDPDGLNADLHDELVLSGRAYQAKETIELRFTDRGAEVISEFLEGFEQVLRTLPARKVTRALRHTQQRIGSMAAGHYRPGDVVLVDAQEGVAA